MIGPSRAIHFNVQDIEQKKYFTKGGSRKRKTRGWSVESTGIMEKIYSQASNISISWCKIQYTVFPFPIIEIWVKYIFFSVLDSKSKVQPDFQGCLEYIIELLVFH